MTLAKHTRLFLCKGMLSTVDYYTRWCCSTTASYPSLDHPMQGLLRMHKDYFKEPVKVVRLWVHECERVLADRMINDTDMTKFNEFRVTVTKKHFDDVNQVSICSDCLCGCPVYLALASLLTRISCLTFASKRCATYCIHSINALSDKPGALLFLLLRCCMLVAG